MEEPQATPATEYRAAISRLEAEGFTRNNPATPEQAVSFGVPAKLLPRLQEAGWMYGPNDPELPFSPLPARIRRCLVRTGLTGMADLAVAVRENRLTFEGNHLFFRAFASALPIPIKGLGPDSYKTIRNAVGVASGPVLHPWSQSELRRLSSDQLKARIEALAHTRAAIGSPRQQEMAEAFAAVGQLLDDRIALIQGILRRR